MVAGVDTTANAVARILDVLSRNPDAQETLRREIQAARADNLSYDDLNTLPYLDAVCRETLRL